MKPHNFKWTKEKCQEEALKYKNKFEYQKKSGSSYNSAYKNGWLNDICSHMNRPKSYNFKWTKEKCRDEALKYNRRIDFFNENPGVYNKCQKNNWLDDFCSHMISKKLRNYWTKEKCINESLKYKTRTEFNNNSPRAYQLCLQNNWLILCSHLNLKIKSYSKEYCIEESKKYKTLKDLIKNNFYLYLKILHNDWMKESYDHIVICGNLYNRCIYSYEFVDNYVYVGLTYNLNIRHLQHMKKGPVFKHIKETNLEPKLVQLTDYIDVKNAKIKEGEYVKKYKYDGWFVLNSSKTGGIGCSKLIKWTKEKCLDESKKYQTKTEYFKNSPSYYTVKKNGWLDELCSHMKEGRKPNNYWNYEKCLEEAKKQKTKSNFRKSFTAYKNSIKNNWLLDIYSNMNWKLPNKSIKYWEIYENCLNESKKYKTPTQFIKKSSHVYKQSLKNKWIEKIYLYNNWKIKNK